MTVLPWAHPRTRREQDVISCGFYAGKGPSSPRVRGAVDHRGGRRVALGAIPAGAGSTPTPRRSVRSGSTPARYGKQNVFEPLTDPSLGPSPRTLESRALPNPGERCVGVHPYIPARAGESIHPSPHARGTGAAALAAADGGGSIPACAGSGSPGSRDRKPPGVHPRAGGEQRKRPACFPNHIPETNQLQRNRYHPTKHPKNRKKPGTPFSCHPPHRTRNTPHQPSHARAISHAREATHGVEAIG